MAEPVAGIAGIDALVQRVQQAVRSLAGLKEDAEVLCKLVGALQPAIKAADSELDASAFKKPEAAAALEGVQDALQRCLETLESLATKGRVMRFLRADACMSELRTCMDHLAHQVATLQSALGVDRRKDLKRQFQDVRNGLVNIKLQALQALQAKALALRGELEQQLRDAKQSGLSDCAITEQLRGPVMEGLLGAGVLGPERDPQQTSASPDGAGSSSRRPEQQQEPSCSGAAPKPTAAQLQEAAEQLNRELNRMRGRKETQDVDLFERVRAALERQAQEEAEQEELRSGKGRGSGHGVASCNRFNTALGSFAARSGGSGLGSLFMPPSFACPITGMCMRDPVMTVSGHTYEREAIERHFLASDKNPVTNEPLESKMLIPNHGLRNSIQEWLTKHRLSHEQADNLPERLSLRASATMTSAIAAAAAAAANEPGTAPDDRQSQPDQQQEPGVAADTDAAPARAMLGARLPSDGLWLRPYRAAETEDEVMLLQLAGSGTLAKGYEPGQRGKEIQELLGKGVNTEVHDEDGHTPLMLASRNGDLEAVQVLLDARAVTEEVDEDANTPLLAAAQRGHVEVVDALLAAGAKKEFLNRDNDTALLVAAKAGKALVVRSLLKAGANHKATDKSEDTALLAAARKGMVAVADVLCQAGADKEARDKDGNTPLIVCAGLGQHDVVHVLLQRGASREAENQQGDTALIVASARGHAEAVRVLLEAARQVTDEHAKALYHASAAGHVDVVRALLQKGTSRDACPYKYKGTALHAAISNGKQKAVAALLRGGVDTEARHELHDRTALHLAAYHGHADIVRMLLERGADKEAVDAGGCTPLLLACAEANSATVKALLEAKADTNARDKRGRTVPQLAARNEDDGPSVLHVLQEAGVAVSPGWLGCCVVM